MSNVLSLREISIAQLCRQTIHGTSAEERSLALSVLLTKYGVTASEVATLAKHMAAPSYWPTLGVP